MNPYEVLGVAKDADQGEIQAAWRALAKKHHPDKGGDPDKMSELNQAYGLLTDTGRRARYDSMGGDGQFFDERGAVLRGVAQMLIMLVESEPDFSPQNLVEVAKTQLRDQRERMKFEQQKWVNVGKKVRKAMKRIRRKKQFDTQARDLVLDMMETRAREVERAAENGNEGIKILGQQIEILEEYECVDDRKAGDGGHHLDALRHLIVDRAATQTWRT